MMNFNGDRRAIKKMYSLTPMQEGILFYSITDSNSTGYVMQNILSVSGDIEEEDIFQAIRLLVMRHDALRTNVIYKKLTNPMQVIMNITEIDYEKIDLSDLNEAEQKNKIEEISELDVKRGFDLENDLLFRVKCVILNKNEIKLIWCYQHIIMDSWCLPIMCKDFVNYYNQLKDGKTALELEQYILEEKKHEVEFCEHVEWIKDKDKIEGFSYWEKLLYEYEEIAEIKPTMSVVPNEIQMEKSSIQISKELSHRIFEISKAYGVAINSILEAAWGIVLQKYNHTEDVVLEK